MNVVINRQMLGLEDLVFGVGTVQQTRGGETVEITKINASNLPFDESNTLKEVLETIYPNIEEIADNIDAITNVSENLDSMNAFNNTYYISPITPSAPTYPSITVGDLWYDTTNLIMKAYNGTTWNPAYGIDFTTDSLVLTNKTITDPSNDITADRLRNGIDQEITDNTSNSLVSTNIGDTHDEIAGKLDESVAISDRFSNDTAKFTIQDMPSVGITNTIEKIAADNVLYKGQTVTDADGIEIVGFNAAIDTLPYEGTFWNGAGSEITVTYYVDASETTTSTFDVADQTSFVNLDVGSIDFTQASNGTGYYHDRSNASGIGGDCIIVNDAGDTRFTGAMALPEDKFIIKVSIKNRDATDNWSNQNGLRGAGYELHSNTSAAEALNADTITEYNISGVILGTDVSVNTSTEKYRLKYTVYTHIVAGDTEQGQPFIYAWNPKTGDVTGVFNGSGQVGHRLPMPFKLDFAVFKNTDGTDNGVVYYGDKDKLLEFYSANGPNPAGSASVWNNEEPTDEYITLNNSNTVNALNNTIYFSGKQNSDVNKIGTYIGNGGYNEIKDEDGNAIFSWGSGASDTLINSSGNKYLYVATMKQGKLVNLVVKNLDGANSWFDADYQRGEDSNGYLNYLRPDATTIESSESDIVAGNNNFATSGATFDWNSDTTQLVLTAANFRFTEGVDEKGYILSRELVNGSIDLTGVSDGEKWIGREKDTGYIVDNVKPEFHEDGSITRTNYDENGLDEFDVVGYTGNGTSQTIDMPSITGGVDFVWLKERDDNGAHQIFDSVRGIRNKLEPNNSTVETNITTSLLSFNTNSFTFGNYVNGNELNKSHIAGCASLPNHTPVNTDGTITSETKSNSFMSAISYVGNATAGATVGHGLSKAPEMIIAKNRVDTSSWSVYTKTIGATGTLKLQLTNTAETSILYWNNTEPDDTVFTLGANGDANGSGDDIIAYAFTSVSGKCKVGAYGGTGSAGNLVSTEVDGDDAFEPAFVMIKRTDSTDNWYIFDNVRNGRVLEANTSGVEYSTLVEFKENGFITPINAAGGTYIYLAIAKTKYTKTTAPKPTSFLKKSVLVVDEKPVSFGEEELVENVMKSLQCTRVEAEEFIGTGAYDASCYITGASNTASNKEGVLGISYLGSAKYRIHLKESIVTETSKIFGVARNKDNLTGAVGVMVQETNDERTSNSFVVRAVDANNSAQASSDLMIFFKE